jgi:hypothetical protein
MSCHYYSKTAIIVVLEKVAVDDTEPAPTKAEQDGFGQFVDP